MLDKTIVYMGKPWNTRKYTTYPENPQNTWIFARAKRIHRNTKQCSNFTSGTDTNRLISLSSALNVINTQITNGSINIQIPLKIIDLSKILSSYFLCFSSILLFLSVVWSFICFSCTDNAACLNMWHLQVFDNVCQYVTFRWNIFHFFVASSSICHKIQEKRGLILKRDLNILEKENFPSVKEKEKNEEKGGKYFERPNIWSDSEVENVKEEHLSAGKM